MDVQSHRDHFFSVLEGENPSSMPFIPDITDWYISHRTPPGRAREYPAGSFIQDSASIHQYKGSMTEEYNDFTLMDFYRRFDWGFHAHIYDWYDIDYSNGIKRIVEQDEKEKRVILHTPKGTLVHRDQLASDGTWCPCEHFVKSVCDLDALRLVIESQHYTPRFDRIATVMSEIGDQGEADIVIPRSPFGKLVQEYMGFENTIYAVADCPDIINSFLVFQETKDMELIHLAAQGPQRLIIISDHADENLIAPSLYEEYCVPFYQKATAILHKENKFVSTHLDGNFKGHFPVLSKTGFDLLDGCTPAPMFNYEVEELAQALPEKMYAFCGVPSTLFCQGLPNDIIFELGDRIINAFRGRGFLNVGDILPPNGDIEQVVALGKHVKRRNAEYHKHKKISKNTM